MNLIVSLRECSGTDRRVEYLNTRNFHVVTGCKLFALVGAVVLTSFDPVIDSFLTGETFRNAKVFFQDLIDLADDIFDDWNRRGVAPMRFRSAGSYS